MVKLGGGASPHQRLVCRVPAHAAQAPWEGVDEWETARLQHRLLTIALLRSFEGRVVASHQSALVLHGVRLWKSTSPLPTCAAPDDDHTRRRPGAFLHPSCGAEPVQTADGFTTVPVARAVVQVGALPAAAGGATVPFESLVAADGALHQGMVTQEELDAAVKAHARQPGIRCAPSLMRMADTSRWVRPVSRSTMRVLGYRFTPQVWVTADGRRWRADFALDDDPVLVEFDGLTKYLSRCREHGGRRWRRRSGARTACAAPGARSCGSCGRRPMTRTWCRPRRAGPARSAAASAVNSTGPLRLHQHRVRPQRYAAT